jgi:hypothetical protein
MALGIADQLIDPGQALGHGGKLGEVTEGIAAEWISFVQRWRQTSTLQYVTRREIYYDILKAGRWATKMRPNEASRNNGPAKRQSIGSLRSPAQWSVNGQTAFGLTRAKASRFAASNG